MKVQKVHADELKADFPLQQARVDRLIRSYKGEWNEEEKRRIQESLDTFSGCEDVKWIFEQMQMSRFRCCVCGCEFWDRTGCNPYPVVDDENAVCCDACNKKIVIPIRIRMLSE